MVDGVWVIKTTVRVVYRAEYEIEVGVPFGTTAPGKDWAAEALLKPVGDFDSASGASWS